MQGKQQRCEASGGVPAVALQPGLMDVLEESRVQDQHLSKGRGAISCKWTSQALPPAQTRVLPLASSAPPLLLPPSQKTRPASAWT